MVPSLSLNNATNASWSLASIRRSEKTLKTKQRTQFITIQYDAMDIR